MDGTSPGLPHSSNWRPTSWQTDAPSPWGSISPRVSTLEASAGSARSVSRMRRSAWPNSTFRSLAAILILALSPPRRVGHPAYTPTKPPQPLLLFQKQVPGQLFEPTLGLAQQQFSLWPRPCGNRWLLGLRLTNWPD